jgi:hypothetical protein
MNTLAFDIRISAITAVEITEDSLRVDLEDGRTISIPIAWYPRLDHASEGERKNFRLIGKGMGMHWPELDEDISVEHMLAGIPSGESQASLKKWLDARST